MELYPLPNHLQLEVSPLSQTSFQVRPSPYPQYDQTPSPPPLRLLVQIFIKLDYLISFLRFLLKTTPSTSKVIKWLYLLWELAILWKNLVLLSSSLIHNILDFCLQEISSRERRCSTWYLKSTLWLPISETKIPFLSV